MRCIRCGHYEYGARIPGWALITYSPMSEHQVEVWADDESPSGYVYTGLCPKCQIPENVAMNNGMKPPRLKIVGTHDVIE